jgi:hypothetical protein
MSTTSSTSTTASTISTTSSTSSTASSTSTSSTASSTSTTSPGDPPDYTRFQDDCSGTFSDNWEDKTHISSSGFAQFTSGELEVNDQYTGGNTGYGSNALCKKVWLVAGKWEFNFRVEPHANQFYDGDTCCTFFIVQENPTYGGSYYRPDLTVGTESGIFFYIGSTDGNDDYVFLNERLSGVSNTLCTDGAFDVQSTHNVKIIVDFDNEWAQLWIDGNQIGTQTNLNASLLATAYPNNKFTVNLHHHNRYFNTTTFWDDFVFYQWGGATTTTTTSSSTTTTTTTTTA